ncbi:MAG: 16S rRNA (cytosine(967)-C(5))-methyltransferase RsmB [Clostridia bacterium]|nr:16S rRNA (cytosine(967)-C(5))-methyltransferase RsmB [Clostridia bacterium]
MANSSRKTALAALNDVTQNEGYSNIVIDKAIRAAGLEPRDAALASALFYGVLEKRMTLDYYIRKFLQKPKQKLDETVLNILRIAVYQVLYLDKIPESAAVNEAVNCAAEYQRGRYKGFVNGVLRGFLRGREAVSPPQDESVRWNIPQAVIDLWKKDYGEAVCGLLLEAMSQRAETFIRINNTKTTKAALLMQLPPETAEPVEILPDALRLSGAGDPTALPGFAEGYFHVQDLSSQLLCSLVDPQPGESVADVCAAPGGKSFTLAERMGNRGTLDAFDLYKGRVNLIRKGAERLGLSIVSANVRDAAVGPCEKQYDRVLCDVPCSGLGVIRRKPEIRYKKPESFKDLPKLQLQILSRSAELVRPGGLLFYSTCTLNQAENRDVVEAFLKSHPAFEPYILPLSGIKHRIENEPAHMLTMMPMDFGGDGFFAAGFRKSEKKERKE